MADEMGIPAGRKAGYSRSGCAGRPETKTHDQIDFPGDLSTKTSGLTTVKLHLTSVFPRPKRVIYDMRLEEFLPGYPD